MAKMINWGIIGCGDVTELKSGPGFNKIEHSSLYGVMRRDAEKAKDYALRHQVPFWSTDATDLICNENINAIYIATPPVYHEEYTVQALRAGKDVYVEKPMALTEAGCKNMAEVAEISGSKLSVAHYRRAMPFFIKINELIWSGSIGEILFVNLKMFLPAKNNVITKTVDNWRINPLISGGGLFFDLAPHQIDMMLYLFGPVKNTCGLSSTSAQSQVTDLVSGQMLFLNNILFNGQWCFNSPTEEKADVCEIIGSLGKISFPFFGDTYIVTKDGREEAFRILPPQHVQQPMIGQVVQYFLNEGPNPCDALTGTEVLRIMESFSKK